MDSDQDLQAAVSAGASFALVSVRAVAREKPGTRSQTAIYECDVVRSIDGAVSSPITLKHFGAPTLIAGHHYVVGIIDSQRFYGAWELRFVEAASADLAQAVSAFVARRVGLVP